MKWKEDNENLKLEIIKYFSEQQVAKAPIPKICSLIGLYARSSALAMFDQGSLDDCCDYIGNSLDNYFEVNVKPQILNFINRKCALEYAALEFMSAQRFWEQEDYFRSSSLFPKAEIQVLVDKIVVIAFDLNEISKVAPILPSEGKYQGDSSGVWWFSLSMLSKLAEIGIPIIKHPSAV